MNVVQIIAAFISLTVTGFGLALASWAVVKMVRLVKLGAADPTRSNDPRQRSKNMMVEAFGHTRMLKWTTVGIAHWFVFFAFGALALTLAQAFGEIFDPYFEFPILGDWAPYGLFIEFVAATCLIGILTLIVIRQFKNPKKASRKSRFAGSTKWQAYYVEWTIVAIMVCIFAIRGFSVAIGHFGYSSNVAPISHWLGNRLPDWPTAVSVFAALKIVVSFAWFAVIGLNLAMGVAWHRFTAFPNIWFKRNADGKPALGPLRPMLSDGKPLDFENADPEKDTFGIGKIEEFTWKGLLDFNTCTECGRCQSQCPAWNTAKPLSPKLVITNLRDHAHAKAPYLLAGGGHDAAGVEKLSAEELDKVPAAAVAEAEIPLIGKNGLIDPDVLWSCTMCGACVEQCPVDIEHVDHIADMRRYQVLIEADFPAEAGAMMRNLESKGNPWGANPATRADWTKNLNFDVTILDPGAPLPDDAEYLFWVGCAGAFDDKAKKTTKAVAELLHTAGVKFAVLGKGETCTGDPARRIGNEFVYQGLAQENIATLGSVFEKRLDARKIVVTCPHCLNTIGNEYPELGGHYDVVHHTELLAQLLAEKRLVPLNPLDEKITYHDPCYLGRHNRVFAPPRELLGALPGTAFNEMPRNSERSFCCGAGGGRMWMEEKVGKRINIERTEEAIALNPDTVAVGCPFCSVMLTDGVAAKESDVAVTDVAQLLHRAVMPESGSRA